MAGRTTEAHVAAAVTAAIKEAYRPSEFCQKLIAASKSSSSALSARTVSSWATSMTREGVCVLRFDPYTETFAVPDGFMGKAQKLGTTSPTYLSTFEIL